MISIHKAFLKIQLSNLSGEGVVGVNYGDPTSFATPHVKFFSPMLWLNIMSIFMRKQMLREVK